MNNLFIELATVLAGAGVIAYFMRFLKQPSIIAYIVTGLIIGSLGIFQIDHGDIFTGLSDIGITLLLFMVGLDLDISQLKRIGKAAISVGIGQMVFTILIGFVIVHTLGITSVTAWYMAIALAFSSTIIVVKLLSEKRDLQSLYGKLAIGIFLIQDVTAIFILIFLSSLNTAVDNPWARYGVTEQLILTLAKAFIVGIVIFWLSKYVFPKLIRSIEKSDELVLLFALAWSLGLASIFSLPIIGFNAAIGGFVAGLALANSGVQHQMSSRIKPIRDFFLIIFFIVLGSSLAISNITSVIVPALVISAFVLIGKPLIVMLILGFMGYKPRVSFMTGVTVAQISEFSLILIAIVAKSGHITDSQVTMITVVSIFTIAISSYAILFSERIFKFLHPILWIFDFHKSSKEQILDEKPPTDHVVLVGAHRLGSHILESIEGPKRNTVIIDFNPDITHQYEKLGYTAICGDISDPYIQEVTNLRKAKLIISTIPDLSDNLAIFEFIKRNKKRIQSIVTAQDESDANLLYKQGADYVLVQHFIGGLHLADVIEAHHSPASLKRLKQKHLKSLAKHDHH